LVYAIFVSNKGEDLERLVEGCHKLIESEDTLVKWDDHVEGRYSKVPRQIDVSLKDKETPTRVLSIVECRDRRRVQDVTWMVTIEGNRDEVGADNAIAVTTTDYSQGAVNYAETKGIDLRVVIDVDPEEFGWLRIDAIRGTGNKFAITRMDVETVKANQDVPHRRLKSTSLYFKYDGKRVSPNDLWNMLPQDQVYEGIQPNAQKTKRKFAIKFENSNPLKYFPDVRGVRGVDINVVILEADVWIEGEKRYPLRLTRTYRAYDDETTYAEIAEFDFEHDGKPRLLRIFRRPIPGSRMCKYSIGIYKKFNPKKRSKR
jgi:hypothetical protein